MFTTLAQQICTEHKIAAVPSVDAIEKDLREIRARNAVSRVDIESAPSEGTLPRE